MTSVLLGLSVVAIVLILQGFFSGSEMALVSANRARLAHKATEGHRGAALALSLLEREDQLLGTCLIGTNLALVSGATLVSTIVITTGGVEWVATLLFASAAMLLGEALPKTVYSHHANTLAPIVAWPLKAAQVLFTPLLWVVGAWAAVLRRLVGRDTHPSREELVMLLDADQGSDIDPRERSIIRNLLEMSDTAVEEAMTPLVEVDAVSEDVTVAEASATVLRSGHSRILVYRERIDNIVGMVSHHDLLFRAEPTDLVETITRPTPFVPESKAAHDLLAELRATREPLAVVVDEYGGVVGIVTEEDLLEELVGEIHDERDSEEPGIRQLSNNEWRIPARTELDEVEAVVGEALPPGDYETVAGLILLHTGRIPDPGEVVRIERFIFLIEQGNERAILQVRLTLK